MASGWVGPPVPKSYGPAAAGGSFWQGHGITCAAHLLLPCSSPSPPSPSPLPPQVLLSLTDNWQQTGGSDEFLRWAGGGPHERFFSDPRAKALYKEHVQAVLGRVNTINGRRYSEDPAIFGEWLSE